MPRNPTVKYFRLGGAADAAGSNPASYTSNCKCLFFLGAPDNGKATASASVAGSMAGADSAVTETVSADFVWPLSAAGRPQLHANTEITHVAIARCIFGSLPLASFGIILRAALTARLDDVADIGGVGNAKQIQGII